MCNLNFKEWMKSVTSRGTEVIWSPPTEDGRLTIEIDGATYHYDIDMVNWPNIEQLLKYKPGKALQVLKQSEIKCNPQDKVPPGFFKDLADKLRSMK